MTYLLEEGHLRLRDWSKGRRFPLAVSQKEARRKQEGAEVGGRGLKGQQRGQDLPWVQPCTAPTPDALGEGSDYLSHPRKAMSSAEMICHLLPTRTDNSCHPVVPAACSVTQGSKADQRLDPPTLQPPRKI